MRNRLSLLLLSSILLSLVLTVAQAETEPSAGAAGALVLSFEEDEYYPLAGEIAGAESLPLVNDWKSALAQDPAVVLWVTAPESLSDAVMTEAGMALKAHGSLAAVGIITGSTREEARSLWQRGKALHGGSGTAPHAIAANGEFPTAGIPEARLVDFQTGQPQRTAMDLASLAGALRQADYLTFTGHGSDDYLRLDEDTTLTASGIPALESLVIGTGSCQTLRIWSEGSIALGFVEQGAAAYTGFVYSPMEGYLIGAFEGLPFRYSWPEFPIGLIAALQTRGTLQGYANFPFHFLLGDPRIALQSGPPYQITGDESIGGMRTLTIQDAPEGIVPVRVDGGAAYRYVEVPGVAATTEGDPFFNARLQAANFGGHKYILVNHPGGELTLRLRSHPPLLWLVSYPLLAAFDHVTLFSSQNGGDGIMLAAGGFFLLIFLLRWWKLHKRAAPLKTVDPFSFRRPASFRRLLKGSIAAGLGAVLLLGLYQVLRLPHAAITTKPLSISLLWLAGVFLLAVDGCGLFLMARSRLARLFAVLVTAVPALVPAVFVIAVMGAYNLLSGSQVPESIYNYNMGLLPLIAVLPWSLLAAGAFHLLAERR